MNTKLISAEEWMKQVKLKSRLVPELWKECDEANKSLVFQIQLNALEWAAEVIGHNAIMEKRPEDWGFLMQRKQLILSQITELKRGQKG